MCLIHVFYQICSLGSLQNHYLKEHRGALQHHKLSLDLNLSAAQYTNDGRTLFGDCISPQVSASKHDIYDDRAPSTDGVNLSNGETWQKDSGQRRKVFTSPEVEELDLNKAPPNESSMSELNVKKKTKKKEDNPVSCKSDSIMDDVLSNKRKGQRLINLPSSELAEVDTRAKNGAVSLLYFSSQCLARNQDCSTKKEVPQTSSESYESIVLKQEECSIDEYCVSSTPMGLDKNEHGVKLKRGRRMKDFRKDILPDLGSLSSEEISEDMKIIDVALRSKEYKKYRSKIASKKKCLALY